MNDCILSQKMTEWHNSVFLEKSIFTFSLFFTSTRWRQVSLAACCMTFIQSFHSFTAVLLLCAYYSNTCCTRTTTRFAKHCLLTSFTPQSTVRVWGKKTKWKQTEQNKFACSFFKSTFHFRWKHNELHKAWAIIGFTVTKSFRKQT